MSCRKHGMHLLVLHALRIFIDKRKYCLVMIIFTLQNVQNNLFPWNRIYNFNLALIWSLSFVEHGPKLLW